MMPRQHIQWLSNLQLAQFHCFLGACSSVLQATFSPIHGAWHSPPALAPGKSSMEKDISLDKVEQAGAQLMHKLPAAVWLPEFPCVLLHHTQHKPAEICSSQSIEVAPRVFCRTVWGAGVAWLLLTAVCTEPWSIHPGSVPDESTGWWPAQGAVQTCQPSWAPKVLSTALAAKTRLLVFWMLD